jgi:hypothetical protein
MDVWNHTFAGRAMPFVEQRTNVLVESGCPPWGVGIGVDVGRGVSPGHYRVCL